MEFELKRVPPASTMTHDVALQRAREVERRREARYPTNDIAEIEVRHGEMVRIPATVVDVSRSGLRLELKTPIGRGEQVKISLSSQAVIVGQVRYSRRAGDVYHAGVEIQEVFHSEPAADLHLQDDELSLYLVGKGLSVEDIIKVRDHLLHCDACRVRLAETDAVLNPIRRSKI